MDSGGASSVITYQNGRAVGYSYNGVDYPIRGQGSRWISGDEGRLSLNKTPAPGADVVATNKRFDGSPESTGGGSCNG